MLTRNSKNQWSLSRFYGNSDTGKIINYGQEARLKMLEGAIKISNAVSATLGPRGRNVIIEQNYGSPKITKDGVTVAKSIDLLDPFQNLGATLLKQVASTTNERSGDGTSTATLIAKEIFLNGNKAVANGFNPIEVMKGIKIATDLVIEYILSNTRPVTDLELYNVACVSANGDKTVGKLIADAIKKVGREGSVNIVDGKSLNHSINFVDGYEFDRGYAAPYFITDPKTSICDFSNSPYVLLCEDKLSHIDLLIPILENLVNTDKELLIVAEDFDNELLGTLVINRIRAGIKICAVKTPGFGEYRAQYLQDLACLTGAKVFSKVAGDTKLTMNDLGQVKRAQISKDSTLLIDGMKNQKQFDHQVSKIKYMLDDDSFTDYDKKKLNERLAKLIGSVAVIHVGGASEVEVSEIKDRMDDALCATKAAAESGILPGGGSALFFASLNLKKNKLETDDLNAGLSIVNKACQAPIRTIAENAGFDASLVIGEMKKNYKFGEGFDVITGQYVNMYKQGILDPYKVVSTALKDAASIASLMFTTEAAICKNISKSKHNPENLSFQ